jgi:ketol-acid reductoisomerase
MMRLTIIGFGNQAKSWALNLRDSGFPLRVALRVDSPSRETAALMGFNVVDLGSEDFYTDNAFALLTPDLSHDEFMVSHGKLLNEGAIILYAHGYSLIKHDFHKCYPKLQHVLFAPKAIGSELRTQYQINGKLGAVYSLEHCKGQSLETLAWLKELSVALGINIGPFSTTFRHETQADLYSEQGLLCSLIPYAASEMFENLVEKGIEPELAYFECWHELKLIVNAMVEEGPIGFFDLISPNALIGSEKGYQKLFHEGFRQNLKSLLTEIQNGTFDTELQNTNPENTRKLIRTRWQQSRLQQTFDKLQEKK